MKNAREIFEEIAHKRMSHLDNLPDYSLWSQEFTPDEVTNMLMFLCENFEKDLEILRKKLKTVANVTYVYKDNGTIVDNWLHTLYAYPNLRLLPKRN